MAKRRIILTHWNAGVFRSSALPHILPELVIYSLLYDEVLIREEDLYTNRHLTRLLSDDDNFRFFEDLLVSGSVKLLRLPLGQYPPGRRFDPIRLPVSARVEEHQLRRTYKGGPWAPTRWEWRLFERLDRVLVKPSAWTFHADFPPENRFAAELAEVLEHRESYGGSRHPLLRKIDPRTRDAFVRFCREPGEWQRFLHNEGVKSVISGPEGGFFRSAAYQCSKLLPNQRRIHRLIESAYAATYCSREQSDGRYGGELLELPYRFPTLEGRESAQETLLRVEAAPTGAVAEVSVIAGVATVLARTRSSSAYAELQRVLSCLGTEDALPLEARFRSAWLDVCDVYAEHVARTFPRRTEHKDKVTTYSVWAYVLSRVVGWIAIPHGPLGLEGAVAIDHVVEHYGPPLLQGFRALWQVPRVRSKLAGAAAIRCSRVSPNTTPQ